MLRCGARIADAHALLAILKEQSEVKRPTALPEPKKLADILGVPLEEAQALREDKPRLLRRLQKRIEELNEAGTSPTSFCHRSS